MPPRGLSVAGREVVLGLSFNRRGERRRLCGQTHMLWETGQTEPALPDPAGNRSGAPSAELLTLSASREKNGGLFQFTPKREVLVAWLFLDTI